VVLEGGSVTWLYRWRVDRADEEEDASLLPRGPYLSVTYRNGMWPGLAAGPLGWAATR
jgi:hypothetical protein